MNQPAYGCEGLLISSVTLQWTPDPVTKHLDGTRISVTQCLVTVHQIVLIVQRVSVTASVLSKSLCAFLRRLIWGFTALPEALYLLLMPQDPALNEMRSLAWIHIPLLSDSWTMM